MIRTEQKISKWKVNLGNGLSQLSRLPLWLSELKLYIGHDSGVGHQTTDSLFRLVTDGDQTTSSDDTLPDLVIVAMSHSTNDVPKHETAQINQFTGGRY